MPHRSILRSHCIDPCTCEKLLSPGTSANPSLGSIRTTQNGEPIPQIFTLASHEPHHTPTMIHHIYKYCYSPPGPKEPRLQRAPPFRITALKGFNNKEYWTKLSNAQSWPTVPPLSTCPPDYLWCQSLSERLLIISWMKWNRTSICLILQWWTWFLVKWIALAITKHLQILMHHPQVTN